jgi:hypothetical protein
MIDADTSLSWVNLVHNLAKLNPDEHHYRGAVHGYGDISFAHGGSGIVISRATMKKMEETRAAFEGGAKAYDRKYEQMVLGICCGDVSVALAMRDINVTTQGFDGVSPGSLREWGFPRSQPHVCMPPVTFHKCHPSDVNALYQFEAKWAEKNGPDKMYAYLDLFKAFVEPFVKGNRTGWDNYSGNIFWVEGQGEGETEEDKKKPKLTDAQIVATQSPDGCAGACVDTKGCYQWKWAKGKCGLNFAINLGAPNPKEPEWMSGWLDDRIQEYVVEMGSCEKRAEEEKARLEAAKAQQQRSAR